MTTSIDGQGEWGGNLDIRDVAPGNRILLPIFHEGALFYLGDVHASQGDTEFTGTAAETKATVRLRLELQKGKRIPGMRIEKPGSLVAIHAEKPLDQAVETATIYLMDWLISEYGFSPVDAYCLVSTCPDFRINVYQMCRIRNLRPGGRRRDPEDVLARVIGYGVFRQVMSTLAPPQESAWSAAAVALRQLEGIWPRSAGTSFRAGLKNTAMSCGHDSARGIVVFLNHPDLVEEVLVNQNRKFIKHYRLRDATRTLGQGLLISEGEFWRGQRKLAQPAFHRERIAAYGQLMVDLTERMLATWADGQVRDAQDDMMRLTLEIVAKTLFDAEIGGDSADVSAAMETLMQAFVVRTASLISPPHWIPTPMNIRVERAIRRLERILLSIIAERRKSGEDRGDLLSMLLRAQDEESGRRMTDSQLRDEMMTLFMAGHETTANTLAWAWFLLSRHPEAEARLHAELEQVLGGRPPTVADLPRLPYTESVINETLRVYPTVWMVGRENDRAGRAWRISDTGRDDDLHAPVGHPPRQPLVRRSRGFPARTLAGRADAADPPLCVFPLWRRAQDLHRQQFRTHGGGARAGDDRSEVSLAACRRCRRHAPAHDDLAAGAWGQGGAVQEVS